MLQVSPFISSIRARVTAIVVTLVVFALPATAQLVECASACNELSLEVHEATGNEELAAQVFDECFQEQCVGGPPPA